mgnify:FL=1
MYGRREQGMEFTGTNAALFAICAGVYLASLGPQGMEEVGTTILQRSQYAQKKLSNINGVKIQFSSPSFKEFVVNVDDTGKAVAEINKALLEQKIFGGKDLSAEFPQMGQCAQYCVTEAHTKGDIDKLAAAISAIVA